jgi:hypothetical protein
MPIDSDAEGDTPGSGAAVDVSDVTKPPPVPRRASFLPRLRTETVWWAIGEISVVVVGVLIAFSLNAWWLERDALRAEHVHLRALVSDFERNVNALEALIDRHERIEAASLELLRLSRTDPGAPADQVRPLLGRVFSSVRFEPVLGAYDALLNSAGLTLIRDDGLRSALAAFAARMQGRYSERFADELYFQLLRDTAGRTGLADVVLTDQNPERSFLPLLADARFQESLALRHLAEGEVAGQYRDFLDLAQQVLTALRGQLT